jgi:hypothetical protein
MACLLASSTKETDGCKNFEAKDGETVGWNGMALIALCSYTTQFAFLMLFWKEEKFPNMCTGTLKSSVVVYMQLQY